MKTKTIATLAGIDTIFKERASLFQKVSLHMSISQTENVNLDYNYMLLYFEVFYILTLNP